LQSVVRGWFATGGRYTHQFAAFIVSIVSGKRYSRSRKRKAAARKVAWENWWRDPKGTFNAIVEQELGSSSQEENTEEIPPSPALKLKLNHGPQHSNTANTKPPPPPAWKIWRRVSSEQDLTILRQGSILFNNASASPLMHAGARRGLLEDTRFAVEVGIARIFGYLRNLIRKVFFLENPPPIFPRLQHSTTGKKTCGHSGGGGFGSVRRISTGRNPGKAWEDLHVFTASDAILRAGYPLEEHSVTTSDGYVLQMHRIPRRGARDVVFMMHGILDTSLGWVVGGTGGSAALEAYDAGFDVWLANTRSNPPRLNTDPKKKGSCYWHYSANELAMCDVTAQVNHIHAEKVAELAAPGVAAGKAAGNIRKSLDGDMNRDGDDNGRSGLSRSATESCLSGSDIDTVNTSTEYSTDTNRKNSNINDEISLMVMNNNISSNHTAPLLRRTQSAGVEDRDAALPGCDGLVSGVEAEKNGNGNSRGPTPTHAFSYSSEVLPYRLQAVGHSLGAALLLMYVVGSSMNNQPHRVRRLILLSPAGFHSSIPLAIRPGTWLMPLCTKMFNWLRPGGGLGLRLPSPVLRWLTFKLLADVNRSPALLDLMKAGLSVATSGDTSEWTAAISLPHYAPQSMPAISLHSANHFAQWACDGNFRFYDYGTALKNQAHYGEDTTKPPSVAENYWRLSDIPVDLAAGSSDGLIPPENVKCHLERLQAAGVRCTLRGFEYGHLDFTFGVKEEVNGYIIQRLRKSAWGGRDS
jgi:pimeloyl-ACP methyl ester carboxylesterase